MLKNITINIADRITVIAGHNGIGKSTILGLIANGSEIKKKDGETLFGKSFQAQFHELFVLDEVKDYEKIRSKKSYVQLFYCKEDADDLIKTCTVSKHKESQGDRLKVVPRGKQEGWDVGESAKVPIPTLFLSMSRMIPLGEQQDSLNSSIWTRIQDDDKQYIHDNFKKVIDNKVLDSNNVIKQEVKGTTKRSLLPEFAHSSKTISLGQDSLSSIITALASFNKLKREQGDNYIGGLLLIDEIEDGFHPKAQIKLIELLKTEARRLSLQVIVTSHSLTIIQEVLKIADETARNGRNVDSVVYLQNPLDPTLMQSPSYIRIKNDMLSILPQPEKLPDIKVYFEDEEAKWIYDNIIKNEDISLENMYHHNFCYVAARLGCDNILKLHSVDSYFNSVVIVLDNDVLQKPKDKNIVEQCSNIIVLPAMTTNSDDASTYAPEYQVYMYLKTLVDNSKHSIWENVPDGYHCSIVKESIIDEFPLNKEPNKDLRVSRKEWFVKNKQHFEKINLIHYFCVDNYTIVNQFINDLKSAISSLIDK